MSASVISVLIALLGLHMLLDACDVPGGPSFNQALDREERLGGLKIYLVIGLFQIIGICIRCG